MKELQTNLRNPAVELYRCVLMYGICVLHAAIAPGVNKAWFINLLCSCVDGFVFITGYYGCGFKPSKVVRLLATGMFCAIFCAKGNMMESIRIFGDYWFLHAYVLMMVFAPLVDSALGRSINLKVAVPILLVIFAWGFAPSLPYVGWIVPKTSGLSSYSGITLLGVYILGRIYRRLRLQEKLNGFWVAVSAIILAFLCAAGLNEYNSPSSALLAGCGFFLFSKIKVSDKVAKVIYLVAPSIFAIYLLHQPQGAMNLAVRRLMDYGLNVYLVCLSVGAMAFIGALVCDIPRRLLVRYAVRGLGCIDEKWNTYMDKVEEWLSR